MSVVTKLLDDMFQILPATTYEDIAKKVNEMRFDRGDLEFTDKLRVRDALVVLRRNPERYGWTLGHVERGANINKTLRYHAVLINKDGNHFAGNPKMDEIHKGIAGTFSSNAQMFTNCASTAKSLVNSPGTSPNLNALLLRYIRFCEVLADLARDVADKASAV